MRCLGVSGIGEGQTTCCPRVGVVATGSRGRGSLGTALLAVACLAAASGSAVAQQSSGSATGAVPGALLGAFAGASVGALGTILPCTQTRFGARCVAVGTIFSGAVGLTSGALVGVDDPDRVLERAKSGAMGLGVGMIAGLLGRPFAQRFGVRDVLAVGLMGGAIGTQPKGALVGVAAGTVLGIGLWQAVPSLELPDAVAAALAGVSVGVLAGWIVDATRASATDPSSALTMSFRIPS